MCPYCYCVSTVSIKIWMLLNKYGMRNWGGKTDRREHIVQRFATDLLLWIQWV